MNPTVSVVITCYNYGQYVEACLKSVFEQTFKDFEIILVNDGSSDDSEEKIKPFLNDHRLKYYKQKNKGQANAKNKGIREAKGDFIAFLDADDLWEIQKLEKQLNCFSDEDVGVVFSRAKYINERGKNLNKDVEDFSKYLKPRSGNVTSHLLFDNFIPFSSSVVRRKILRNNFNENIKMGIDWELWLFVSMNCKFAYVDEKLLHYRIGHAGQMSKNTEERFRCTDLILKKFLHEHREEIDPKLLNKALAYKYYLRWEYYKSTNSDLANKFLFQAIKYKIDLTTILKGFGKSYLRFIKKKGTDLIS